MTAELVRGQNHPVSQSRVEIRVSAGTPVLALASLADEQGRFSGDGILAHPGARSLPGVRSPGELAERHTFAVDLDEVAADVHRLGVLLVLPPGGPVRFGAVPASYVAVADPDGAELAGYTLTGLDAETAVVALELYRRQGAWKVRAVGQGYAEGLGALLTDGGLAAPQAAELAAAALRTAARTGESDITLATMPTLVGDLRAPQTPAQAPAPAPEPPDPVPRPAGPRPPGARPRGGPAAAPPPPRPPPAP
ncbi:TerD family protein, partial [Streptomyces sp. NPDC059558]|uniref:TerD family protein n=1 Tax=Streptomyces sp. NPDC059558 TaxID=3346864 RepID=UPI003684E6AB